MSGKIKAIGLVVGVSYVPYTTGEEKHHIIGEQQKQGWTFKKDTDKGLCFYLIKGNSEE